VAMLVLAAAFSASCSRSDGATPIASATHEPTPTPKAVPLGGTHKMGAIVQTAAGSRISITNWVRGATDRPEGPGPNQVYESIGVGFCAGPNVDVTGSELVHLFSLELPNGNRVSPDSLSGPKDLRKRGRIAPGKCVLAPIVFQVGGGTKPAFVVFESDGPLTKWKVP
jgi:hypothetical protein